METTFGTAHGCGIDLEMDKASYINNSLMSMGKELFNIAQSQSGSASLKREESTEDELQNGRPSETTN